MEAEYLGDLGGCSRDEVINTPLIFEKNPENLENNIETQCILCRDKFNLNIALNLFLKHLFEVHNVIIEDTNNLPKITDYINYWREKLEKENIEEIIPSIKIELTNKNYYIFSDLLREDKELRHKLNLENALKVQEFERVDVNYQRTCLLCKFDYKGCRKGYFEHLTDKHNLQLGNPQNLVFIDEFIDKIDEKLTNLQCLYCDKIFPDRVILKEHMRKKSHKKINPSDKGFDKYFIINYLEPNKNWRKLQRESDYFDDITDDNDNVDDDDQYSDWQETSSKDIIKCLFCDYQMNNINFLCLHMEADHEFDFQKITKNFDFYQKIKLINYLRKQFYQNKCGYCNKYFDNLKQHLYDENHCKAPDDVRVFDQVQYYFPTFENDAFLYYIEDVED